MTKTVEVLQRLLESYKIVNADLDLIANGKYNNVVTPEGKRSLETIAKVLTIRLAQVEEWIRKEREKESMGPVN